jgi:hypothetical protein
MAKLDRLKEQIAYFKYWLGVVVLSNISLIGWLLTSLDSAPSRLQAMAIFGVIGLTCGAWEFHRRIARHIRSIGGRRSWKR